jgi:hypothetical protein
LRGSCRVPAGLAPAKPAMEFGSAEFHRQPNPQWNSALPNSTRPRQESNLHPALRRRVLYPLSYEGWAILGG